MFICRSRIQLCIVETLGISSLLNSPWLALSQCLDLFYNWFDISFLTTFLIFFQSPPSKKYLKANKTNEYSYLSFENYCQNY
ncbi:uncharacterized protein OCT59_014426 [Rhizophagus irregularis]|uniref:uncharacterized protein n=1 Tax=Rhizophagus irregularis TaxID=588596 RepID=UPI00331E5FE6|nr:hypothetical protein OCT59_014426 [Rhizophagus irregularis]